MKLAGATQGRSLVILLSLFAVVLLLRWAFLDQMDALTFDLGLRLRGVQAPDPRIAIVAVDDGSLDSVGSWPWEPETLDRLFGQILETEPRALGVDILLTLPVSNYPSIAAEPRVVLAAALGLSFSEGQPEVFWQEVQGLSEGTGPGLGHIHANKDSGGICRSIPLGISHSGRRRWAFALETARVFWGVPPADLELEGKALRIGDKRVPRLSFPLDESLDSRGILPTLVGDHLLINLRGGNQTFPYVSASEVLEGKASALARLRNRIVLVGATAYSLGDHLSTPFSGPSEMPGVEIHANAIDTIINGRYLGAQGEPGATVLLLASMLLTWGVFRLWSQRTLVLFALGTAAALILPFLILRFGSYWIPQASLAAAIMLTAATAQFFRFSSLDLEMNQRFRHLSQLLRGSSSYRSSAPTGLLSRLRTRSLEWKLAVLSDATENALRAARSQEDMVSFVSHQLQTPLASIRGFADLLGDEGKLSPKDRALSLNLIQSETERLASMVEGYLSLVRLEHGATPVHFKSCRLDQIVSEACRLLRPQFQEKKIQLRGIEELAEDRWVEGDEGLLRQVLLNLLSNALKYSPSDTGVSVRLGSDETHHRISIQDQGAGISEADLPHLFQRFFRSQAEEDSSPGSGLGLAFASEVVELHRGSIGVESQLGEGATFTVQLPQSPK